MKDKTKKGYSTKTTDNLPYKKTIPNVKPKAPYKTTDNIHSDGKHSQNLWIEFSKAAKYMETGETFYEMDVYSEPLIDFLGEIFVRGKILNQVKDLIKQANKHVFSKDKKEKTTELGIQKMVGELTPWTRSILSKEKPIKIKVQAKMLETFLKYLEHVMSPRQKTENALREDRVKEVDGKRTKYIYKFGQVDFDRTVEQLKIEVAVLSRVLRILAPGQ